jgi:hypothetical protein
LTCVKYRLSLSLNSLIPTLDMLFFSPLLYVASYYLVVAT